MDRLETSEHPWLYCEECETHSIKNPFPDVSVTQVECEKCKVVAEIEWIDDSGQAVYNN